MSVGSFVVLAFSQIGNVVGSAQRSLRPEGICFCPALIKVILINYLLSDVHVIRSKLLNLALSRLQSFENLLKRNAGSRFSARYLGASSANHVDEIGDVLLGVIRLDQRQSLIFFKRSAISELALLKLRAHAVVSSLGHLGPDELGILRRSRPDFPPHGIEFSRLNQKVRFLRRYFESLAARGDHIETFRTGLLIRI